MRSHSKPIKVNLSKLSLRVTLQDASLIILAIALATFGLKSFLLPNHFIDGGVTGISLLIAETTGLPLGVLIFLLNLPFVLVGRYQISLGFSLKTALAILLLSISVSFVQMPIITNDKLLVAVFGGFFLGAGIGLAIRGGCVIDGTEVLSLFVSRRTVFSIGDVILVINVFIFIAAATLLGIEPAMYSMLTYIAASRTVDFLVHGVEEYTGVTIISEHSETIRTLIINELQRGVTVYQGKRGFGKTGQKSELEIIFTVVTRLEKGKLKDGVLAIDPNAFILEHKIDDLSGGMIKKRPLH